jgi:hypothetical protein
VGQFGFLQNCRHPEDLVFENSDHLLKLTHYRRLWNLGSHHHQGAGRNACSSNVTLLLQWDIVRLNARLGRMHGIHETLTMTRVKPLMVAAVHRR